MNFSIRNAVSLGVAVLFALSLPPAARAQATNDVHAQIRAIIDKIEDNAEAGKKSKADSADELAKLDAIIAQFKGVKTEDAAETIYTKAMLFAQVFKDFDTAISLINNIKSNYPDTDPGHRADQILDELGKRAAIQKVKDGVTAGKLLPDFSATDLEGKPLASANFKGKVLLIDFWATWCPPCRAELPDVIAAYKKYHTQGFEIIGVSLDEDKSKLTTFIKEQGMTWQQYWDGKGWESKIVKKFGVDMIPFTILIDGDGHIIATAINSDDLDGIVAKALKNR